MFFIDMPPDIVHFPGEGVDVAVYGLAVKIADGIGIEITVRALGPAEGDMYVKVHMFP